MSKDTRTALVPLSCHDINAISKAMHLAWLESDYDTHGALDRILQRYFPAMEKVIEENEVPANNSYVHVESEWDAATIDKWHNSYH